MAKENIARFFDAAMTDKALAERLAALAAEHGTISRRRSFWNWVRLGPSLTKMWRTYKAEV